MIADIQAALAVLTRLPVGTPKRSASGARAFGLVGALVGLLGFVPLVGLGSMVGPVAALLAIAAMAIATGLLHLDGLADTADALVALGPAAAERARKDPSIGAGGAVALVVVMGLEAATLTVLIERSGTLIAGMACIAAGACSRVAPVVLARSVRPAGGAGGLGAWFRDQTTWLDVGVAGISAGVVTFAAALLAASASIAWGVALGLLLGVASGLMVTRWRGQLDGDGLGATVEMSFAASLACTATLVRWPVG